MMWHEKSKSEALSALETDVLNGLSQTEAMDRLQRYGSNKLNEKKRTSIIIRFFLQFNDFMIIVLLAAAGISFFTTYIEGKPDFTDPIIILAIISLNAVLGLVQENKAEKSIEALKKMTAPTTKVLRNSNLTNIKTEDLVPGDIIFLETGDLVPADARIIESHNLKAEESALTGESVAVEKDADLVFDREIPIGDKKNMLFSGSSISYGRCTAMIVETGMNTEVGKIAKMIMDEESLETPLQKKLADTGKKLGIGAIIICVVIFVMGLLRSIPPFEMFMTSVSLAVAAIPEGLPAIVTIMLAIGVQRMANKNAVIRKLPAVETLGSANVICSDKTGTLTQNKMKVVEISNGFDILDKESSHRKNILKLGSMCNDCIVRNVENGEDIIGDPTEAAIVISLMKYGIRKYDLDAENERIAEIPFDSKRKLMTTIHTNKNSISKYTVITKGAPDVLLNRCTHYLDNVGEIKELTQSARARISKTNAQMAEKALRVLGTAFNTIGSLPSKIESNNIENSLVFAGLIGMIDPPRKEVFDAVNTCREAGIKTVMVTGDHISTAMAIAKKIGIMKIGDRAMTGDELNKISVEELSENIFEYSVFARVSPEHKMKIVKAFQSRGAVVAMTGDGVNDAPALKAADIGCAMGISGTDVAKGAADMVLTDDNFATIVDAVKEGRGIYSNIRKAVHFLLSSNIGEIITIFVAILFGWNSPLLAIHLLWVNLVTDSLPAIALGLDPSDKDVMKKRSYGREGGMFSQGLWQRIIIEGCMIGMLALLGFGIGSTFYDESGSHIIGRTMAFATLSISQLVHAFNMRSDKSIFSIDMFENKYLIGALVAGLFLQVSVITFKPVAGIFKVCALSPSCWFIVVVLCLLPVILVELEKYFARQRKLFTGISEKNLRPVRK